MVLAARSEYIMFKPPANGDCNVLSPAGCCWLLPEAGRQAGAELFPTHVPAVEVGAQPWIGAPLGEAALSFSSPGAAMPAGAQLSSC